MPSEHHIVEDVTATASQVRERHTPALEQEKHEYEEFPPAPPPHWELTNKHNARIPLCAAHRGFKLRYPENTLSAFKGALEAGANALETDLHVSRDGVVVLSHDPWLKRCFGVENKKVVDCDWEYLSTLRTVDEPVDRMPRFVDLLEFLDQEGREDVWVLLDIKLDNDPNRVIPLIAEAILSHPPNRTSKPWCSRFVLGCWSAKFLPLCAEHLPKIPITLICFDISYARQFLTDATPNIGFNINQRVLMGPLGRGFLEEAKKANRMVYVWTVNAPNLMRWCVRHKIDAIMTDDPVTYGVVAAEWKGQQAGFEGDGAKKKEKITFKQRLQIWVISALVLLFGWAFKLKFLPSLEKVKYQKAKAK